MRLHSLKFRQLLAVPVADAWRFFSDPRNLARITPSWMGFEVTSELPERVYAGLLISYRIRPVLGLPVNWVTEITHLREPFYFVDEQRFGPYRFWHHEHTFRERDGGVEMEDTVHYGLRFGLAAEPVNSLFVRPRLRQIFDYRREVIARLFSGHA